MSKPRFPEEFKIEAVKQVTERGYPVAEVASRLGVSAHSLYQWLKRYDPRRIQPAEPADQQAEIRRLKAELKRVTEERDILKNVWSAPILQTAFAHDRRTFCVNVFGLRLEAVLPALMESARSLPHKAFSHYRLLF